MAEGIKSTDITLAGSLDEILGGRNDGSGMQTRRALVSSLAAQMQPLLNLAVGVSQVVSRSIGTPPVAPPDKSMYIVPTSGLSGVFVGQANKVAIYNSSNSTWSFNSPVGYTAIVLDEDRLVFYDGAGWVDTIGATSPAQIHNLTSVASSNGLAYTANAPAAFSMIVGTVFIFQPNITNTGAVTITITPSGGAALGPFSLVNRAGAAIGSGQIGGKPYLCRVSSGTQFQAFDNLEGNYSFQFAALPSAASYRNQIISIRGEITRDHCPAYSDGTGWFRVSDDKPVVSALPAGAVVYIDFEKNHFYYGAVWRDSLPAGTFAGTYLIPTTGIDPAVGVSITVEYRIDPTAASITGTLASFTNASNHRTELSIVNNGVAANGDIRYLVRVYTGADFFIPTNAPYAGRNRRRVTYSIKNNVSPHGAFDNFAGSQAAGAATPNTYTGFTSLAVGYRAFLSGDQALGVNIRKVVVYDSQLSSVRTANSPSPIEMANRVNLRKPALYFIGDSFLNLEGLLDQIIKVVSANDYLCIGQEGVGGTSVEAHINRFLGKARIRSLVSNGTTATLVTTGGGSTQVPLMFAVGSAFNITETGNGFNGSYTVATSSYATNVVAGATYANEEVQTITFACAVNATAARPGYIGKQGFFNARLDDTIVMMDGALNGTDVEAKDALSRLFARIGGTACFMFIEGSPQLLNVTNPIRVELDGFTAKIKTFLGDRFAPTLALMQAGGSFEYQPWTAGMQMRLFDTVVDTSDNRVYKCVTAHLAAGSLPISTNADKTKFLLLAAPWLTATVYTVGTFVRDTSEGGYVQIYRCAVAHTSSGSLPISTNADAAKWTLIDDLAGLFNQYYPQSNIVDGIHPTDPLGQTILAAGIVAELTKRGFV